MLTRYVSEAGIEPAKGRPSNRLTSERRPTEGEPTTRIRGTEEEGYDGGSGE